MKKSLSYKFMSLLSRHHLSQTQTKKKVLFSFIINKQQKKNQRNNFNILESNGPRTNTT